MPESTHHTSRIPVSYTHLRAHETPEHLVCRLLLEKKRRLEQEDNEAKQRAKNSYKRGEKSTENRIDWSYHTIDYPVVSMALLYNTWYILYLYPLTCSLIIRNISSATVLFRWQWRHRKNKEESHTGIPALVARQLKAQQCNVGDGVQQPTENRFNEHGAGTFTSTEE